MKNILSCFLMAFLLISCDDGELIVTEFDFDNEQLSHCSNGESQVLYNVNNQGVNESIAFIFQMNEEAFKTTREPVEIAINANNQIIYRTFDGEVVSYYCSEIPPSSPRVVREYRSTSGGVVTITPVLVNVEDHDGDGVPSSVEMEIDAPFTVDGFPDTDGDGIPNYLDIDDDNDNVPTSKEINRSATASAERFFDTDGDGIPDYLDEDDDGDGTITRYEDLDRDMDPTDDKNDENVPNYLNPDIVDAFEVNTFIENKITRSYRLEVSVDNLTLQDQGGDGEEITMTNFLLGFFNAPSETITLPEESEEEEEEEETEEVGNPEDEDTGETTAALRF